MKLKVNSLDDIKADFLFVDQFGNEGVVISVNYNPKNINDYCVRTRIFNKGIVSFTESGCTALTITGSAR